MLFTSSSPEDTEKIGECLGSVSKKGYVICLTGELGVGKTEFVKGFSRGVGVDDYITSPTFTIVNEYKGRIPLYHFDVYRINDVDEMYEIGFEEYLYGEGVTIIEWADLIESTIPEDNIKISITKDLEMGEDYRTINIEAHGAMYNDLMREMIESCEF